MNYWLSRDDAAAPEGPYTLDRLRAIVRSKTLGPQAMACREGEEDWRSLMEVLADPAPVALSPQESFAQTMAARDRKTVDGCGLAIQVLCGLAFAMGAIPGLGIILGLAVWLPVACIISILAVIQMVKGSSGNGLGNLLFAWLGLPFLMAAGQAIGLGLMGLFGSQ